MSLHLGDFDDERNKNVVYAIPISWERQTKVFVPSCVGVGA